MKKFIPATILVLVSYVNHIISLYVTEINIDENKVPLTDIVHKNFNKIDTKYTTIAYYFHILNFMYFALFHCKNKLGLYYRMCYFISFLAILRCTTLYFTYYPNARECKDIRIGNYCGDMMFSGHTAMITSTYLAYNDYNRHITNVKKYIQLLSCIISIFLIVISRMHYTNDVIISSYITYITWK